MLTIVTTILVFLVSSYFIWFIIKRRPTNNEPPMVPYYIPWLGRGMDYQKDAYGFLRKMQKKYGPIFTVHMGGRFFHFVSDPFTHPIIAKEGRKLNFRLLTVPFVKKVFDITRKNPEEATNHGLFQKYLQGEKLEDVVAAIMENLYEILRQDRFSSTKWTQTNLLELSYSIMFPAGFKALFGQAPKSSSTFIDEEKFEKLIRDFVSFDGAFPKIVQGYPITSFKGVKEARDRLWSTLATDQLEQRDGVHPLIQEVDEYLVREGNPQNIPKQNLTQLFAAESNTVIAAFWALYYVIANPEAQKAAYDEITRMLKETSQKVDSKSRIHFNRSELGKMTVLESIVNESLRLGVSSSLLRLAVEDYDLNIKCADKSYRIRKGDSVLSIFQLTHLDAEIFPDPERFKFDRFINPDGTEKNTFYKNGKVVRFHLQPFGSGVSKCPGRYLAVTEIKQYIIQMLLYYDMELIKPLQDVKPDGARLGLGSLNPNIDPPVRFRRKVLD